MRTQREREWLQVQLIQTEHLLSLVSDHPLMGPQFVQRAAALRAKLEHLPADDAETQTEEKKE